MPDMGPETTAATSEEPVPSPHEGRLVGARLSVNMLVGGVLVLMLMALIPFFFMKNTGSGRSESPAPNAPEAARWNGSNSQVSNWPAPLSQDAARTNDNSANGNRSAGPNNGVPLGAASPQDAAAWGPPGAQPPTSLRTADGSSPWNGQTPRTPAADATGAWGGGNRGGAWSNPSAAADTAADRATNAWGDPSQNATTVPQAAPLTEANRPVGPMMPTTPPVNNGGYQAGRPASAYQNNSSEPSAYTADTRGGPAMAPLGAGAATTPPSYPNTDAAGTGANYPNAYQPNTSPSNGYLPNNYSPNNYPPSGYPTSVSPSNAAPTSGYPSRGYPSNASPTSAYPTSAYPTSASPSNGYPSSATPSGGYPTSASPAGGYPTSIIPSNGYPTGVSPPNTAPSSGYPSRGYPTNGYPSNANTTSAYPTSAYPTSVSPSGGYPSNGYPSSGYPSSSYPSNNANAPYPGTGGPAVNPMTNGTAGYNGGTTDAANARFNGGIDRPTIPGGYDNAQPSLH
jgi:hypothetical protein